MSILPPREQIDLGGCWELAFDPSNCGKDEGWATGRFPVNAVAVTVPSVWNLVRPGYEGVAFYRRNFSVPADWHGRRVRLAFAAANYFVQCWVNGRYAGDHDGGYTSFSFDVTALLDYDQENELVVRVVDPPLSGEIDGLRLEEIACAKETWYYRYGGLWGEIALEAEPVIRCDDVFVCPDRSGQPTGTVHLTLVNGRQRSAAVTVSVIVTGDQGEPVAALSKQLALEPGETAHSIPIDLTGATRWSPERPRCYRCRCELRARDGTLLDARAVDFGLRTFDVMDGEFQLNGAPIILKGVLYQPNFPRTLVSPPDAFMAEKELRLIKESGFNLIRFHLRPPHPQYLDLADRLGLLVYEETALAWIVPSEKLAERSEREVDGTIRRDRNHPSIVLWGLFNENQRATAAVSDDLLSCARALDPTRPIIDNSGGTAAVDQDGSWQHRTRVLPAAAEQPADLADLHLYFGAPVAPETYRWLSRVGQKRALPVLTRFGYGTPDIVRSLYPRLAAGGKVFVSELGYGGLPDLDQVAGGFGGEGELIDAAETRAFRDRLRAGLAARGLDTIFGGLPALVAATQWLQAKGDARQVAALRSNPRVSGYVVTQFNDAAWEFHAGLVDLWRHPKHALAAVAAANAERCLFLWPPRHAYKPGEIVPVAATFVDETGAAAPTAHLRFTIADQGDEVREVAEKDVRLSRGITRLPTNKIRLPARPGSYTLRASLADARGEIAAAKESFVVLQPVDWGQDRERLRAHVALALPDSRVTGLCGDLALGVHAGRPVLLVSRPGGLSHAGWREVGDWVGEGGRAIVGALRAEEARRLSHAIDLGRELGVYPSIGCFVGWFHYVKTGGPFDGLPANCIAGEPYALVLPHYSLDELGGTIYAGAFTSKRDTDCGRPGFVWRADLQEVSHGQGQLVFCQYRVFGRLGRDPVAERLFFNLLSS